MIKNKDLSIKLGECDSFVLFELGTIIELIYDEHNIRIDNDIISHLIDNMNKMYESGYAVGQLDYECSMNFPFT